MSLRRGLRCLMLAGMLLGVSCDSFFEMYGTVCECGTDTGIPQASGKAVLDDYPGVPAEVFATDNAGNYRFGFNAPRTDSATVTFEKAGYVPIARQFKGIPNDPTRVDFCMDRAP